MIPRKSVATYSDIYKLFNKSTTLIGLYLRDPENTDRTGNA